MTNRMYSGTQPALLLAAYCCLLAGISLGFAACAPAPAAQTTAPLPADTAAPTESPEQAAVRQAWQSSPHADTYDPGKGPNTYCARCHSPYNWDPQAVIDAPPNCVSCKFPTDQEIRVAAGNPLVPEEDWRSIDCPVCHLVLDGEVEPDLAWLDAKTGFQETLSTPTELCEKCHTNTETLRHQRELGEAAHASFTCVDCHDPHSAVASCTTSGCHPAQAERTAAEPGHDPAHAAVACTACHDASGLAAGPLEDGSSWVTWRTTSLLGRESVKIYQSHTLQRDVDCTRCHFPENTWGLNVLAGGEP